MDCLIDCIVFYTFFSFFTYCSAIVANKDSLLYIGAKVKVKSLDEKSKSKVEMRPVGPRARSILVCFMQFQFLACHASSRARH